MDDLKTPKGWRKGQTIFNFLWWLNEKKGYHREVVGFDPENGNSIQAEGRLADVFNLDDAELGELFDEFLELHTEK